MVSPAGEQPAAHDNGAANAGCGLTGGGTTPVPRRLSGASRRTGRPSVCPGSGARSGTPLGQGRRGGNGTGLWRVGPGLVHLQGGRSPVLFFCLPSCQFGLQFPDAGFGRQSAFPFGQPCFSFGQPAFLLLLEGGDFLPGLRVVPAKVPAFPPDVEVQDGAVALQDAVADFVDGIGSYRSSTSRSPASLVLWNSPVSSNRQHSGILSAAYLAGLFSTSCLPVLLEAISMTKSGGLPCREMT